MKRLRRLVSSLVLCCFLLCSCLSLNVSALEDKTTGDIPLVRSEIELNGKTYDLVYSNPDIQTFSEATNDNVILINAWYTNVVTGVKTPFDPTQSAQWSSLFYEDLNFYYQFKIPDSFPRGDVVDIRVLLFTTWVKSVVPESAKMFFYDSNGKSHTKTILNIAPSGDSSFVLSSNELKMNEASNRFDLTFTIKPNLGSGTMVVDNLTISSVSNNGLLSSIIDYLKNMWESIKEIPEKITSSITNLGNKIGGFFTDLKNSIQQFFIKLIEDIKGLFIPSDEFWQQYHDKWLNWFKNHFGAIYDIYLFTDSTIDSLKGFTPDSTPSITLPAINLPLPSGTYHLMDMQVYSFDIINQKPWSFLYDIYQSMVWVIAFMALYKLLISTYERIVNK